MSDNQADADVTTAPESGPTGTGARAGSFELSGIITSPLIEAMRITITHATPELLVATMPVEGNTQPYGLLHGGASCVLAETLGSIGAALHAMDKHGGIAVGIDIN